MHPLRMDRDRSYNGICSGISRKRAKKRRSRWLVHLKGYTVSKKALRYEKKLKLTETGPK